MVGHLVLSHTGCGTVCLGMCRRRHVVEGSRSYSILEGVYNPPSGLVSQAANPCRDFGNALRSQDQAGDILPLLRAIWCSVSKVSRSLRRYRK